MEFSVNRIAEYADKCDAALNHNYTRVRVEDQLGKQLVNWSVYKAFEEKDMLLLITAEDGDELAGFAMYVLYIHPHHPYAHLGQCQFLIVQPKYRGKGLGRLLVEHAEIELKRRGCSHMTHNRRMAYDVDPLFPKIGFDKFEETYVKELK